MTEADQPFFQQWLAGNPTLRLLINDHRVPTLEDQMKWFVRVQQPDRKMFSLIRVRDDELLGNGGFVNIDAQTKSAVFRITIGNPVGLDNGYGTEATRLILQYGFETMGLQTISLEVLKSNPRAIRTYEKVGFVPLTDGTDTDILRMSISREQFAVHTKAMVDTQRIA